MTGRCLGFRCRCRRRCDSIGAMTDTNSAAMAPISTESNNVLFIPPRSSSYSVLCLLCLALSLASHMPTVQGVLPTGAIDITLTSPYNDQYTLYASQASFGSYPQMKSRNNPKLYPTLPPSDDPLLCNESKGAADYSSSKNEGGGGGGGGIMIVPRGTCTFERKALSAQRLGARGIIIYGTLGSRYSLNETKYNSKNSTDNGNERTYTESDIVYPQNLIDYDCSKAQAFVSKDLLSFDPLPYNSAQNDPLLSGSDDDDDDDDNNKNEDEDTQKNLCALFNEQPGDFTKTCPSHRCLLTGKKTDNDDAAVDDATMEACCAWDLHVWLYADPSISTDAEVVTIPAFYITMEQGTKLLNSYNVVESPKTHMTMVMYARYRPEYNVSALLIWMMGVAVAALAAYASAREYRQVAKDFWKQINMSNGGDDGGGREENQYAAASTTTTTTMMYDRVDNSTMVEVNSSTRGGNLTSEEGTSRNVRSRSQSPRLDTGNRMREYGESMSEGMERGTNDNAAAANSNNDSAPRLYRRSDSSSLSNAADESLELNIYHALGFVIMASSGLLILFFLKIYNVVKVMYAFGCGGAVTQELFLPIYTKLCRVCNSLSFMTRTIFTSTIQDIGSITRLDILSAISGYGLALAWLIVAFLVPHPDTNTFFWITQDIMGACMCILFLGVIKLNSIRVASALLIVAFLYDIFFVFVTPYLFKGQSVMITVATSGGPPKADPSWCEKYPHDKDCQGGDPLPMLLTIPRLFDYQGGASLLGLGDIVLPGLLLSFAARFDAAKRLVGLSGGGSGVPRSSTCPETDSPCWFCKCFYLRGGLGDRLCNGGYFVPLIVAYAVGLLMANTAVYLMNMGQPALLYLVPSCLGTMVWLGYKRNELDQLWHGPKVLKAADSILYGEDGEDGTGHVGEDHSIGRQSNERACRGDSSDDNEVGGEVPLLSMT